MIGPLLGFGAGYTARDRGVDPLTASMIGLGTTTLWLTRAYVAAPIASGVVWAAADVGAGLVAGTQAAVAQSSILAGAAAIAIPVAAGAAVVSVIAGEEGLEQYEDFLRTTVTDPVAAVYKLDDALDAAYSRFDRWNEETPGITRALEGNAAGLPAGTTEWEINNPHARFNPFTGEPNRAYTGPHGYA